MVTVRLLRPVTAALLAIFMRKRLPAVTMYVFVLTQYDTVLYNVQAYVRKLTSNQLRLPHGTISEIDGIRVALT